MAFVILFVFVLGAASQGDPYGFVAFTSGKIDGAIRQFASIDSADNVVVAFAQGRGKIIDAFQDVYKNANTMSMENRSDVRHGLMVTGIISSLINDVKKGIESAIDYAAVVAKDILSSTIEEIKSKIIDEIGKQVQNILAKFFSGVSQLLDQFWNIIQKTNCAVISGNVDKIIEFLDDLGRGCSFLDECCRKSGYNMPTSLHSIAQEAPSKLYDIELCRRQTDISDKMTKEELSKIYMDSQILAKKFYCVNYGSSAARDHYGQEYTRWGSKYFLWQKVTQTGCADAASCYNATRLSLSDALRAVPFMVPRSTVTSAAQNVSGMLRNGVGWCDCYNERISPDTGTCPHGECEWAKCSKEGYFAKGYLFTDIHEHDSYGLTTNGYSSSYGGPLECCRPCYSPLAPSLPHGITANRPANISVECATASTCYNEAVSELNRARSSTEEIAGKEDIDNLMSSVKSSLDRGYESCDCYYEDLGPDTNTCGAFCGWAQCSQDGYFPVGLLFTDIHKHDSLGLAPPGYSSDFKSVHCCKPCVNFTARTREIKLVGYRTQAMHTRNVEGCQSDLECYEAAINMLVRGVLELQAKASKSDLDSALASLDRGLLQASWTGTDKHGTDNLGTDTHACTAYCVWGACGLSGHFITGLLWTDIHDHDSLGKTTNGYSPLLKPVMCAAPAFAVESGHQQPTEVAQLLVVV